MRGRLADHSTKQQGLADDNYIMEHEFVTSSTLPATFAQLHFAAGERYILRRLEAARTTPTFSPFLCTCPAYFKAGVCKHSLAFGYASGLDVVPAAHDVRRVGRNMRKRGRPRAARAADSPAQSRGRGTARVQVHVAPPALAAGAGDTRRRLSWSQPRRPVASDKRRLSLPEARAPSDDDCNDGDEFPATPCFANVTQRAAPASHVSDSAPDPSFSLGIRFGAE